MQIRPRQAKLHIEARRPQEARSWLPTQAS